MSKEVLPPGPGNGALLPTDQLATAQGWQLQLAQLPLWLRSLLLLLASK